jgi:hypothetical protein
MTVYHERLFACFNVYCTVAQQENGFFVECGALDGELRSNTLFMERNLGWEGVLIEADPKNFLKVQEKNRRAWTVPACLSTSSSPK